MPEDKENRLNEAKMIQSGPFESQKGFIGVENKCKKRTYLEAMGTGIRPFGEQVINPNDYISSQS